jgi:hypothetical protein
MRPKQALFKHKFKKRINAKEGEMVQTIIWIGARGRDRTGTGETPTGF